MEIKINSVRDLDLAGKRVLFRPDINATIDRETRKIISDTRLRANAETLKYMLDQGAKVAIIAHQGDALDYENLQPLEEHAEKLSEFTGYRVTYIDDVCGPAALAAVMALREGEAVILGNLRYLGEELSTFDSYVRLTAERMRDVWHIRKLAPLFDVYVNDAFSAAHRRAPSMVGFQQFMPSAAGFQFFTEYEVLTRVLHGAEHPSMFVLGGAKISDAFGMMEPVLKNGTADKLLITGVTGVVMHLAKGKTFGEKQMKFLKEKNLLPFVDVAKEYLAAYPDAFELPLDFAYEKDGERVEVSADEEMPDAILMDVGEKTVAHYRELLLTAKTIFANGPAGVYENPVFENGTKGIWQAIADSDGYSVMGGGDTGTSAKKFIDMSKISYMCTAGGAMVNFMSGKRLPLVEAMEEAYDPSLKK